MSSDAVDFQLSYIPHFLDHSCIHWMFSRVLDNFNLSVSEYLVFLAPSIAHISLGYYLIPLTISIYSSLNTLYFSFHRSFASLGCPLIPSIFNIASIFDPWLPHVRSWTKYYDLIYNTPFISCFPGSAVHACSPCNSQFQTFTVTTTRGFYSLVLLLPHRDWQGSSRSGVVVVPFLKLSSMNVYIIKTCFWLFHITLRWTLSLYYHWYDRGRRLDQARLWFVP